MRYLNLRCARELKREVSHRSNTETANNKNFEAAQDRAMKYRLTLGLFARCLGLLYFVSFTHLTFQVKGLLGSKGISPVKLFLRRTENVMGKDNVARYFYYPSVFWIDADDRSIIGACVMGSIASLSLCFGIYGESLTRINFFTCYVLKLSLCVVGGDLFAFPWDYLLMEVTLLSMLLPPLKPLSLKNGFRDYGLCMEPTSTTHRLTHFALIFLCVSRTLYVIYAIFLLLLSVPIF